MRPADNWLLAQLGADDLDAIVPHFTTVDLPLRTPVEMPQAPIRDVLFLTSGIVSVVGTAPDRSQIEIAIVGREGMTGLPLLMGVDRWSHRSFMQGDGAAFVIGADVFVRLLEERPGIRQLCGRFLSSFLHQVTGTSLANGRGTVEQRLARWLVMAQDRTRSPHLVVTHEFLSYMLAVRRAGVTNAIHILEGDHLVKATRGHIEILDRAGLITRSRYYGFAEAEYARLLGDFRLPLRG